MANQIVVSAGAKVRNLQDVIIGTSGVLTSLGFDVANGVPRLDVNGKILVSQLPNSVMEYKGTWNAATNTPTLVNGTGNQGDVYLCNVAGTVNFGAGAIAFVVGDQVIYSGSIWQRASGATGTVTSVAVTESGDSLNITGSPITTSGTINIGFNGTNLQYVNGAGNLTTFPTLITSIGLSMPSAFSVANSPLTANGTIAVTGAGTTAQYIRGDGSLATFPTIATEAQRLITEVYNETGATLTKGTVVYINGGHGNLPTVTKAIATGDSTSAQTYGVVQTDITNMNNGYVVVIGSLGDLDTQAYPNGTQLYLSSTTAGAWTSTKQYAPAHLVYVGIVTRSHPTQGVVEVRIQNGFEMDELHNVSAQTPSNGGILQYVTSTGLWTAVAGTTTNIAEGTNLYYTDARARAALSFVAGSGAYNSTTGVITIPTNNNQITNGSNYITLGSLSAGVGISYNNTTGVITNSAPDQTVSLTAGAGISVSGTYPSFTIASTITQYTDALARAAISLTTTGTSGAATYNNTTGVLNIPQYADQFVGTVTSVAALTIGTSGTDLSSSVANSTTTPVITLNVPTASATNRGALSSADWTTFNSKQGTITLTTTGTSGAATFSANTLNIPNYGSALSGYLPLTGGTLTGALGGTSASFSSTVIAGGTIRTTGGVFQLFNSSTFLGGLYPYATWLGSGSDYAPTLASATDLYFATGDASSKKMILTSSGNLGLGVTPSAWYTGYTAMQIGESAALFSNKTSADTRTTQLANNAYLNSGATNWIYAQSDEATRYGQVSGEHQWYTAPSGTAGNAITFTQAMTLFNDGNLLLTNSTITNAGYKLDVNGTGRFSGDVIVGSGGGLSKLTVGNGAGYTGVVLSNASSVYSWLLGSQYNVNNGFEITPSTAIGGSTFTTPVFKILNTGAATFSSSVTANAASTINGAYPQLILNNPSVGAGIELHFKDNGTLKSKIGTLDDINSWQVYNGGAIRFTINNSGNVGIGTSSPSALLHVGSGGGAGATNSITYLGGYSTGVSQLRYIMNHNGAANAGIGTPSSGGILFGYGAVDGTITGEWARITTGGNVLIGTTDDGGKVVSYTTNAAQQFKAAGTAPAITFSNTVLSPTIGGVLGVCTAANQFFTGTASSDMVLANQFSAGALIFGTSNVERTRITSGGYLKASNTGSYLGSTGAYHELRSNASDMVSYITNTNATPFGIEVNFTAASPNNTSSTFYIGRDSTTARFRLYSNGGLANYQANDVNLSDKRTKKDIIPLESYWDKFKAIEIVKFKYKDQTHNDYNIGVIAQQVESVAPEFIDVDGWGETPKDGIPLKSVYTADLHHATIRVLQECMAKIEEQQKQTEELKLKIK